jgi:hypothetical protein
MATHRAHLVLPTELLAEVDELVGARGRSAFVVEVLTAELRRRRLQDFFESKEPLWNAKDHPELKQGAATFVRKLRRESDAAHRRRDGR